METAKIVLSHPFTWGFALGGLFFVLSFWSHLKTKRELRRFQKHLGDKLELEAKQYEMVRKEKDELAKEAENLRLRVGQLNERPDHKLARDLEILTRAEKRMTINAPGFAPAWETAKSDASRELDEEDRGRSIPKRLFTRLFGNGADGREGEHQHLLDVPTEEGEKRAATSNGDTSTETASSSKPGSSAAS